MKRYYLQRTIERHQPYYVFIWEVDGARARCLANDAEHNALPGEDIIQILKEKLPFSSLTELELCPGEYYPRMARPDHYSGSPGYNPDKSGGFLYARTTGAGQLHALLGQLERVCQVVHPRDSNLQAYGHETRNILILACTEVKAYCKNILKANGTNNSSTRAYVKLLRAIKLDEYGVTLNYYPWLEQITPFKNWNEKSISPSKDLVWYDAYNSVKHDQEMNFSRVTLENVFSAVTACFVLLCAQYGWDFALSNKEAERAFFQLTTMREWEVSQMYIGPLRGGSFVPKKYPFK